MRTARLVTVLLSTAIAATALVSAPADAYTPAVKQVPRTMAAGVLHSVVISADGRIYGVGSDGYHQMGGIGDRTSLAPLPPLPGGARAVAVAAGNAFTLALASTGVVYGVGENTDGQLTGTGGSSNTWRRLAGQPVGVRAITAVGNTTAVVGSNGRAYYAGENRCHVGAAVRVAVLTEIPRQDPSADMVQVAVGGDHCVTLASNGYAYGMGSDANGQTTPGTGYGGGTGSLVYLNAPAAGVRVTAVAAGLSTTYGLGSDGEVYGIGANYQYQLGDGTTSQATETDWTRMLNINGRAVSVSAVMNHVVVGTRGGTVFGAGTNNRGQLTRTADVTSPRSFRGWTTLTPMVEVSTGGESTTMLRDVDGVVHTVGRNDFGQLGHVNSVGDLGRPGGQIIRPYAAPSIAGTAKVKRTLTARVGSWAVRPTGYRYTWLRNGAVIAKATRPTYKLAKKDRGKRISVIVTASRAGFTSYAARSAQTKKVVK